MEEYSDEENEEEQKKEEEEFNTPHIFLYGDNKVGKTSLLEVLKNQKIKENKCKFWI